jgi:tetratricopeptide (TPR) repeat protein
MLRTGNFQSAKKIAEASLKLANYWQHEHNIIYAERLYGSIAVAAKAYDAASQILQQALVRSRIAGILEEEIAILIMLAELQRQNGDLDAAREYLSAVWGPIKESEFLLHQVDALNVLTQIEQDAKNHDGAAVAARDAFRIAWCDGTPFSYHWGLNKAKEHIRDLGIAEPEMPPFDQNKHELMPTVEVNPKDDFYVEANPDNN